MINKIRSEEEILKDFEKLGYFIVENSNAFLKLELNDFEIKIIKYAKKYCTSDWEYIDMQEHQLLHELFICYGWIGG